MKFTLEITELENAAFSGGDFYGPRESEIARIVRHVADCVETCQTCCGVCHDINGNRVGTWGFKEETK